MIEIQTTLRCDKCKGTRSVTAEVVGVGPGEVANLTETEEYLGLTFRRASMAGWETDVRGRVKCPDCQASTS